MGIPVNRLGFTRLDNGKGRGGYRVNIIFVHGLMGHPKDTWGKDMDEAPRQYTATAKSRVFPNLFRSSKKTDMSPFWPHEFLADDIPTARVWTYGYDADLLNETSRPSKRKSIVEHGSDLAAHFEHSINNREPVVFVAHDAGGIVVKWAIRKSQICCSRTKLIVFLGTPHRGGHYCAWGTKVAGYYHSKLPEQSKQVLESLQIHSEILDHIHDSFKTIVHQRGIKIFSFQECRGIAGLKNKYEKSSTGKVVDNFSSKADFARAWEQVDSLDADHWQMAKCTDKNDDRYRAIVGVIKVHTRY